MKKFLLFLALTCAAVAQVKIDIGDVDWPSQSASQLFRRNAANNGFEFASPDAVLSGLASNGLLQRTAANTYGIATISSNLSWSAGTLDTAQGIQTSSTPQFSALGIGAANIGDSNGVTVTRYGAAPTLNGQRAQGTPGSPTVPTVDINLFQVAARGWDGSSFANNQAQISFRSSETWSGSAKGTYITWSTTPTGGTTLTEQSRLLGNGNFLLGTTTDSSNGRLQLATHTTSVGGIGLGTDLSISRAAIGAIRADPLSGTSASYRLALVGTDKAQLAISGGNTFLDYDGTISLRSGFGGTGRLSMDASGAVVASGSVSTNSTGGFIADSANPKLVLTENGVRTWTLQGTAGGLNLQAGSAGTWTIGSNVSVAIANATSSTSTTTGALTVAGGLGINGAVFAGGNVNAINGSYLATTADGVAPMLSLTQTARRQWRIQIPAGNSTLEFRDVDGSVTPLTLAYATGNATFIGSVKSSGATSGIGYATGAGGAQTQGTSRATAVTLNNVSGAITLFTAAGSATPASFTVNNSAVAATDTIVLSVKSSTNKYLCFVTAVGAGSFEITFYTTGGTASDAPVINFSVIKAVAS